MYKILAGGLLLGALTGAAAEASSRSAVVLSPMYTIDRKWGSMQGPRSTQPLKIWEAHTAELLWITGFRAEIVAEDGVTPMPQELFCHINVDWDSEIHGGLLGWRKKTRPRVISLSQGQTALRLPEGSGIPVFSDEPLTLTTQVLNHNLEGPPRRVRHRVTIDFFLDRDLEGPLRPLFPAVGWVLAVLKGPSAHPGIMDPREEVHGEACLPGKAAPNAFSRVNYRAPDGGEFTGHWIVSPGRETRHTNVTALLNIPFDTTLHFAAVHLHPFALSLELRDLTEDRTVFRAKARGPQQGIGLAHVDTFSSAEGVPIAAGHQYQLVSVYETPPAVEADAMAAIFLLLEDREFKNPAAGSRAEPYCETSPGQARRADERDLDPR